MPRDSRIGQNIDAIDTPAMVVDLAALQSNLDQMAAYFEGTPCRLRPHFKSHKCVELARRQLAAGNASGITCAKLSEAEQLVAGGVTDILIANQVIGQRKAQRLAELNRHATVRCAVDSLAGIRQLSEQAQRCGQRIPVLVEVDVGMRRCGAAPGDGVRQLVENILDCSQLRFDGLQGYEGHLVPVLNPAERHQRTLEAMRPLVETRRLIEDAGIEVSLVSGGSTSTYQTTGALDGIDEVQVGTYALMDWAYRQLCPEFRVARWILATVISAGADSVVVDVGLKGIGCDFGPPAVAGHPDAKARYTAEEHTPLDGIRGRVGDRVRLIPSHGCTTSSLHRRMWILHEDTIVDVWDLEGAGCLE